MNSCYAATFLVDSLEELITKAYIMESLLWYGYDQVIFERNYTYRVSSHYTRMRLNIVKRVKKKHIHTYTKTHYKLEL